MVWGGIFCVAPGLYNGTTLVLPRDLRTFIFGRVSKIPSHSAREGTGNTRAVECRCSGIRWIRTVCNALATTSVEVRTYMLFDFHVQNGSLLEYCKSAE